MKAVIGRKDLPGLVVMVVIGIGLSLLGSVKLMNASETNRWPITTGIVTSSEVGGAGKFYPSVNYTYRVDSVEYTSNRISTINVNTKKRSDVEEILKSYPVGTEVKVYYNLSDPSEALLQPGVHTGNALLLAFGILILAIPILLVIFMKVDLKKGV